MDDKKSRIIKIVKPNAGSVFGSDNSKEKMQELKDLAKVSGQMEIDNFKNDLNEFISKIEDTVVFGDMAEVFKSEMLNFALTIENVLKGIRDPDIPERVYKEERLRMLKGLIEKYNKQER